MLKQLLVRNIALVDELTVSFYRGLNVLTGETGAGKSIIVDSVNFLIGARADKAMIRSGAEKAYVEGVFDIAGNDALKRMLADNQMEPEDESLILSRELSLGGRSVCRIDGTAVNLALLKEVAACLIDIHGQHEHQSLLDEKNHLGFLDAFGDSEHQRLLLQVATQCREYQSADAEYRKLLEANARRQERLEFLLAKRKEIAAAKPKGAEEESLRKALDSLRNAGKISRALQQAYGAVYDTHSDADAALRLLQAATAAMAEIAPYDDSFEALRARLESMYYEAEDIGLELRGAIDRFDTDEGALQQAAARMDLLRRLSRKYAVPIDDLAAELEKTVDEIKQMDSIEDELIRLEEKADQMLGEYKKSAALLTVSRRKLAGFLAARLKEELAELNMPGTELLIELTPRGAGVSASGDDRMTMLLAPNKGEEAKSLSKIASGGEVSRLMLALKSISASHNVIPSMVFDEIDTGISGRTAQVVAEKMWNIARYRQVLCVTHLQQIAAMAGTQYLVVKSESGGRTISRIHILSQEGRIKELSRMISGYTKESESSLRHAEHMLKEAEAYRLSTK